MAKRQIIVKKPLEDFTQVLNYLLVLRSVHKTDIYDFYISVAKYRVDYICWGKQDYGDINKTLTINNLFELNILLYLFTLKK